MQLMYASQSIYLVIYIAFYAFFSVLNISTIVETRSDQPTDQTTPTEIVMYRAVIAVKS